MQVGQLDQWVTVERQAQPADSFAKRQWSTVETGWASVQAVRSSAPRLADAQQSVLTHTVLMHWSAALAAPLESGAWRVRFTDIRTGTERVLAVQGPARDLRHAGQWLIFDCVEGLADGH